MSQPRMVVTNPEPPPVVVADPRQRRLDTQERRRRLAVAYNAAVHGYPRGDKELVYALPARFTSTARADDPVLERTYRAIAELRARLSSEGVIPAIVAELYTLVARLRPGQRRYLAQQMLRTVTPPETSVCGVCWDGLDKEAMLLPCRHYFHPPCMQTAFDNGDSCRCTVCKRDITLAALLHDATNHQRGANADAFWKSLPVDDRRAPPERPLTPPLRGAAPSLAAVKESWRSMVNAAYDNDNGGTKERGWQLDTDLRRLSYTTPQSLRDKVCIVHDIGRALATAGFKERCARAMGYLGKQRVRANLPLDLNHCCGVCKTPIASSETASPPCRHVVHAECWPFWFQQSRGTHCPKCPRDVAVFACMAAMAKDKEGLEVMKDLWMTVEDVYF